jgi:hypothetical protein
MNTFVLLIYSATVFSSQPAYFQNVFPAEQATQVIRIAQQNFWGKAVLSNGTLAQPADENERNTLPIPRNEAMRIVQSSTAAGLGAWCGVEWQSYYLAFMGSERAKPWSEKQIAFIGMLFGVAQGSLQKSMSGTPCGSSDRESVARMLRNTQGSL